MADRARQKSARSLTVVIVNWNAGLQLRDCVASVLGAGPEVERVVVVDNGSTDGSPTLSFKDPRLKIVLNGSNDGFARACNAGARDATSDFLLFFNPDATIDRAALLSALDAFVADRTGKLAVVGIQNIDQTGHVHRSCARFPTLLRLMAAGSGLDRFMRGSGILMTDWDHQQTRLVDHVIGSFYLVRREVFEAVDGFDEDYFVYFEDLDLSRRIRKRGYDILYLADAGFFHQGGGTSGSVKALRTFMSARGRIVYARKWLGLLQRAIYLPFALVIEPAIRIVTALASGGRKASEEAKAAALLLRWYFKHRHEPRWMPARRTV